MTLSPLTLDEIDALLGLLDSYPNNLPLTLQLAGSKLHSLRAFNSGCPPELSIEDRSVGLGSFPHEGEREDLQAEGLRVRSSVTGGIGRVSFLSLPP